MSRPLRIEFPGAVYHVTARGDRREPIYRDDADRTAQPYVIARAMQRFDAQVLAYCQMGNHFHVVPHARQGNPSRLMRHINGVYTRQFRSASAGLPWRRRFRRSHAGWRPPGSAARSMFRKRSASRPARCRIACNEQRTADRPEALRIAYRECGITMTAMAKELQLSVSRISRPIAAAEAVEGGLWGRGKT